VTDTRGRRQPTQRSALAARLLWLTVLAALLAVFAAAVPKSYELYRGGTIGILLDADGDGRTMLTPIPGQAGEQAGVRNGDVLLAVDGQQVATIGSGMDLLTRLRDAPGVPVTLTVARADGEIVDLTVVRTHPAATALGMSPETYARVLVTVGLLFVLAYTVPAAIIALR